MSEEKQIPKVEPTVPTEKVETEVAAPQQTTEELQQEIVRKEEVIKQLKGSLKAAQERGVPKEELTTLHKRIDDMQEWYATVSDDLARRISGEEDESKPVRKTYSQQLEDKRKEAKPKEDTKLDPDVQKFINYIHSQELEYDNPLVQEAVADERTPQEALKYLKDKAKGQTQAEVDKLADEKAKTLLEQKLKDLGYTVSGASGPSAPASTWREKTPEEKLLLGVSGKK
ncbi:MAG TPA: hypothetical protein VMY79_00015 [Dehalococcoidia bacterium]|nr:hypothetical protein [Dehalococcoidia bacterium]